MNVAITGASGLIGSALADRLEAEGHRAVRLVRPQTSRREGDVVAWDPAAGTIDAGGLEGLGDTAQRLRLRSERLAPGGNELDQATGPISPGGVATLKADVDAGNAGGALEPLSELWRQVARCQRAH